MSMSLLSPGRDIPNDVNVVIEIAAHSNQVKYEVDKDSGLLAVDRFMPTAMHYPCDYGYIPNTLAEDGDPVDMLVMTPFAIQPGCLIRTRVIGMLNMIDESGRDCKLLALPTLASCPHLAHIQSLQDVPPVMLDSIVHFFEHYKDLEPNKWVKLDGWEDQAAAADVIQAAITAYQAK